MDALLFIGLGLVMALAMIWFRERYATFLAQDPEDYAGQGPEIDIRRHLNGPIACEGVIYGPTGRVTSRFVAKMNAQWDGDTGVMTEVFRYDNGSVQNREWHLTLEEGGRIRAEAPDVVGVGSGRQSGPGVLLKYKIRLPEESGGHVLDATDWMYLIENGTIMNRSQFRKFGIKVAELVATMRPLTREETPEKEAA